MADTVFSLLVWTKDTNMDYFKNMLESIDEQEYRNFELYILDNNQTNAIESTIHEFFPDMVDKVHYRPLKKKSSGAYAYNIGAHFATGDYFVFLHQHDRLSANTLLELNKQVNAAGDNPPAIIYTDHDELEGLDRIRPYFKGGFNKELLLHTNYIGDFYALSRQAYGRLGPFNEKATYAYMYEYLIRAMSKKEIIDHIQMLLYHKRVIAKPGTGEAKKEAKKQVAFAGKEHMALAVNALRQEGVVCQANLHASNTRWTINYDHSSFRRFGGDYMYLHEKNVRLYTRHNVEKMYGYLKQPDVGIVGIRFVDRGLTYDNAGYIFDHDGVAYPAFHGQKILQESYEGLALLPRDVAMVDAGCCLIDEKVYRSLRGFDPALTGRDAMLDFCIRARKKGYRTVVIPECIGRYKSKHIESSGQSNAILIEKHPGIFEKGDDFYNKNLLMGLQNYMLPGAEEE